MATEIVIGIDLGTTNSCVAICKNNTVDVLENEMGSRITPSCVTFTEEFVLTGPEAADNAHRGIAVFEIKRLIGQRFHNEEVQNDIRRFTYPVFNDLGSPKVRIDLGNEKTQEYYPEEISAFILHRIKKIAEKRTKQPITKTVVTVPAYFNDAQRQATKDAATIAGFKTVNIINEPTAAALAFNYEHMDDHRNRNILVYDFGGGTFDVSVVNMEGSICKILARRGDLHLGGTDIDTAITEYIKNDYKTKFNKELAWDDPIVARRLKYKSESAKIALSGEGQYEYEIEIDYFGGENYHTTFTRIHLETVSASIFKRTMNCVQECLKDCHLKANDIAEVILVGGSSRIPKIHKLIRSYFGAGKINRTVNPDEAMARGAAIYAANLTQANETDVPTIIDVTSFSIGTDVDNDMLNIIIPRNTALPANAVKKYTSTYDKQTLLDFPIYQGENSIASENVLLGKFTMTGLTKAPKGEIRVEINCHIDCDGILNITAVERNFVNNSKKVTIDIKKFGLSTEQLKKRIGEIKLNNEIVRNHQRFVREKYKLESLLKHVSNAELKNKSTILPLGHEISKWLETVSDSDAEKIREHYRELKLLIKEGTSFHK